MPAQTTADPPPTDCLNCYGALPEPRPRFCPACGQETHAKPPTIGEFVQQFGGAYLSTEGALWRTLVLLLTKPGELTRQYLAGRRRHYVLPLRLYLTISLIVLLALRAASGLVVQTGEVSISANVGARVELGFGRAGIRDGRFLCEDLPGWICKRLQRRFDVDPKALSREVEQIGDRLVANIGAVMFVLLPSFALWLKLFYVNRRMRYTEHLVFALHLHAFWFIAIGLMVFDQPWLSFIAFFSIPIYAMLSLKRVYGGPFWPRLARAAAISALHLATLSAALAAVALWSAVF